MVYRLFVSRFLYALQCPNGKMNNKYVNNNQLDDHENINSVILLQIITPQSHSSSVYNNITTEVS